jgi:hypothetical protein
MFLSILGGLTGLAGPITATINRIADVQKLKEQAKTDREKMAYDQQIQEAQDRKAVLVAEAGNRLAGALNASMRIALAIPAAAVLWKLLLWDKVIGSFNHCSGKGAGVFEVCSKYLTDPLSVEQWAVITAVIGFYFIYDMAAKSRK